MQLQTCCPQCQTPVTVEIPGTAGLPACTNTTADFIIPAIASNITVSLVNTTQFIPGAEYAFAAPANGVAHFQCVSITNATQAVFKFLGETGDAAPGVTITDGSLVCPSGEQGTAGVNGENGYATTTSNFTVPSIGNTVTVPVDNSTCFVIGEYVIATAPANFIVTAIPNTTSVTIQFLGNTNDVSPGATINSGSIIAPAGEAGQNAYTLLTSQITIPAKGATVTAPVLSTQWMAEGENVFISANGGGGNGGTFQVTTITDATNVVLTFLQNFGDLAPANTLANGSTVTPTGKQAGTGTVVNANTSVSYPITQGTPMPVGISLTIPAAGTWRVLAICLLNYSDDYNGYNGQNPVTLTINRSNNTPTDLVSTVLYPIPNNIATLYGYSTPITLAYAVFEVPIYSTANSNDALVINASYLQNLAAGNINVVYASLTAQQTG